MIPPKLLDSKNAEEVKLWSDKLWRYLMQLQAVAEAAALQGGAALGNFVGGQAVITSGDLTTASASFVDVDATNMKVTLTTGARRCLVSVVAVGHCSGGDCGLDIDLNGVRLGETYGLVFAAMGTSQNRNLSFTYMTDVLTAGSNVFKLMFRSPTGATLTLFASTSISPLIMSVVELPVEA